MGSTGSFRALHDRCLLAPSLTPISAPVFSALPHRLPQLLGNPRPPPFRELQDRVNLPDYGLPSDNRWCVEPYSVEPGIDIPAADTARTIDIPSTQETDCEIIRWYIRLSVNGRTWWHKQSAERLESQHTEVRPVRSRSTCLTGSKELPVTKEQIDGLVKGLDELRLGMDDGDVAHALQAMQGEALLTSVISVPVS